MNVELNQKFIDCLTRRSILIFAASRKKIYFSHNTEESTIGKRRRKSKKKKGRCLFYCLSTCHELLYFFCFLRIGLHLGWAKYRQLSENFASAIFANFNLLKVNLAKAPILSFNLKSKVYDIKHIL